MGRGSVGRWYEALIATGVRRVMHAECNILLSHSMQSFFILEVDWEILCFNSLSACKMEEAVLSPSSSNFSSSVSILVTLVLSPGSFGSILSNSMCASNVSGLMGAWMIGVI